MRARPRDLVDALDTLLVRSLEDMDGAFSLGPTFGDDVLPDDPIAAMRRGGAHKVPLIVGTNADEGKLFTRFMKLLPTTEQAIERLLSTAEPEARERITAAYPGYPRPDACVALGGDFAFGTAAWQIAEAHSAHAPTYVYRYDYAPRTLHWSGLGATHATELLAVFDIYRTRFGSALTAAMDRRSALKVSRDLQARWRDFSRTGVPGDGLAALHRSGAPGAGVRPAHPGRDTIRTRIAARRGRAFRSPAASLTRLQLTPVKKWPENPSSRR